MPTPAELSAFLGPTYGANLDSDQAASVLQVVTSHARAHTRGVGFDADGNPNADIAACILSGAARLISHIRMVQTYESFGPAIASFGAAPFSWSLAETLTLDRYTVNAL